jgi:hypothetical protein
LTRSGNSHYVAVLFRGNRRLSLQKEKAKISPICGTALAKMTGLWNRKFFPRNSLLGVFLCEKSIAHIAGA